MTVKESEETKTFLVYETATHKFKIGEDKLDKMQEGKDYLNKLSTMIQKTMKQTIDSCSGEMWEESAQEFFTFITKQKQL
ncbi:MAG: hypothetical protein Q7R52_00120 [archaeon]|nr:hypothetical protein [archaeon]